jgi:hypothetical protein
LWDFQSNVAKNERVSQLLVLLFFFLRQTGTLIGGMSTCTLGSALLMNQHVMVECSSRSLVSLLKRQSAKAFQRNAAQDFGRSRVSRQASCMTQFEVAATAQKDGRPDARVVAWNVDRLHGKVDQPKW